MSALVRFLCCALSTALPFCETVGTHASICRQTTSNLPELDLCSMLHYNLFDYTCRRLFGCKQAKLYALDYDCNSSSA
jgi:hypothetical protein